MKVNFARSVAAVATGLIGLCGGTCCAEDIVYYVATTGSDSNAGTEAAPFKTITKAVSKFDTSLETGGRVVVKKGTYTEAVKNAPTGYSAKMCLHLKGAITIEGETGDPNDVIVTHGSTTARILLVDHARACVRALTLRNGQAQPASTNAECDGSGVLVTANGGTVENCIVTQGGVNLWNSHGNGIYAAGGRVSRCVVTNLTTASAHGAVYAKGNAVIDNCLIAANPCGTGHAVELEGNAKLINCTITGNTGSSGAGVNVNSATAAAVNCAIMGNRVTGIAYGAVWARQNAGRYFNCAADGAIEGSVGCVEGQPVFANPDAADWMPLPTSCLLDAGTDPGAYVDASVDLAGNPRAVDAIDIGCYENQKAADKLQCGFTYAYTGTLLPAEMVLTAGTLGPADGLDFEWTFTTADSRVFNVTADSNQLVWQVPNAGVYSITLKVGSAVAAVKSVAQFSPPHIYVDAASAAPVFPYMSPGNAAVDIKSAYAAAADGAVIHVADGVYPQQLELQIGRGVTIIGESGDPGAVVCTNTMQTKTTVDGSSAHRLFNLNHPAARIANLTLAGGLTHGSSLHGAAVYISQNGGTVSNCVIRGGRCQNSDSVAGAACLMGGLVTHTVIEGIFQSHPNSNPSGGYDSYPLVVKLDGDEARMENCLIRDIGWVSSGVASETYSSVGPIIRVQAGSLVNCTVAKCSMRKYTGALVYGGGAGISAADGAVVRNCVAVDCLTGADVNQPFFGPTASFSHCAGNTVSGGRYVAWGGTGCVAAAPEAMFAEYASGNYQPRYGGAITDRGLDLADASATDLAGNPRRLGQATDIGCYECTKVSGVFVIMK